MGHVILMKRAIPPKLLVYSPVACARSMSSYPPDITYRELTINDYEDLKEYVS
ncbi:hypothetical protein KIN20_019083 [Parelaphostrongylus tenuis]|uniref:Uncharacterized protein n=1 Tax=Parelaphostrongylus tenuis TaxID=148309 RepID=A0AAD5N504_PARTN|nr:hypothetical protein KIN20_019083 [Parelaphostrongylus tenuis]